MGKIKATRKYENPIEFEETHKLWMDANHKPEIRGTDNAIWNRLHLIPFEVTIPKDEIYRGLPEKLLAEAPGVLLWAVDGAVRWHHEGLARPEPVESAGKNGGRNRTRSVGLSMSVASRAIARKRRRARCT
jgi:putative DNA primase/helicase